MTPEARRDLPARGAGRSRFTNHERISMSTLSVAPAAGGRPTFEGVDAVRADGGLVHIRPFAASDAEALRTLHARLSDRSMYLRFFGLGRSAGEKYVTLLMQPASPSHQTLTAWIGNQLGYAPVLWRLTSDDEDRDRASPVTPRPSPETPGDAQPPARRQGLGPGFSGRRWVR